MSRWLRRGLWTVAILAILALAALAYVGQRIAVTLVTPALLREVTAGMQPPHPGDPQAALGLAFEDVTYDTPLGPAPAIWIPADARPGAPPLVAIFVHGIGGRPEDGYGFVPALNDAGVPVLMIAYRNDPGAPPAPDGLYGVGTTEWADLEAAVLHLRSLGHERVLLIGASMGGAVVGQLMRRSDESEGVVGLAFDSGVFDGGRSTAAITRRAGIPFAGLTTWLGTTIVGWRTGLDLAGSRVTERLAVFDGPVFVTQGSGDMVVPVDSADELVALRSAPTTYVRTNGDHLEGWAQEPLLMRAAFDGLLDRLLAP